MNPSESTEEKKTLLLLDSDEIRELKRVPYAVKSIQMIKNEIEIKISYTGGCKSHFFELIVDRNLLSKQKEKINLNLSHDDNGDRCKKIVSERLVFDLSPLLTLIYPKNIENMKVLLDGRPVNFEYLDN